MPQQLSNRWQRSASAHHLAGERVPRGTYKQLGSDRTLILEHDEVLPATMDGRVACYVRIDHAWEPRHAITQLKREPALA